MSNNNAFDDDQFNNEDELDNEDFVDDLYQIPDKNLKKLDKEQDKNKKSILDTISKIILAYTVVKNLMKLKRKDRIKLYWNLSALTQDLIRKQSQKTESAIKEILKDVAKKSANFYNTELTNEEALDIINKRYKGATFSDRIYKNNDDISKALHKHFNDFLKGKTDINDIKDNIEKSFDVSKYQAKRLVDTELTRIHDEIFKRNCKENGVEKIIYKATFCNTCKECASYDGMVFDIDEAPYLPTHVNCRCFYTYKNEDN